MLSVLIPVRDASPTLDAALGSVLAEPGQDIEFLVVDDGSRDGSLALARAWAERDRRLRVIEQGRHGLVAALGAGVSAARGEFLARHDADDLSVPPRLRESADCLAAHADVDLVASRFEMFRDGGPAGLGMTRWAEWSNALATHEDVWRERFVESPFAHPSVTMRLSALRALDGYREGDFPEDYELWLRFLGAGRRVARLPLIGVRVRDHAGRTIRREPKYRPEAFRALKLRHLRAEFLRQGEPVVVVGGGRVAKRWLADLRDAGIAVAALLDLHPRRIGRLVAGVPVRHPREAMADPASSRLLALGAVGRPGARESVRETLRALGRKEGKDFVLIA
ncbi:MAG TPA: glycosyltransferase family A protein [Candidatus Eisenbacteria bacterium]|nr:glycosyltransferase family A protein [Candidatus Eisenbacteria bacterium]